MMTVCAEAVGERTEAIKTSIEKLLPRFLFDKTASGLLESFIRHKFPLTGLDCSLLGNKYSEYTYNKHYRGLFKFLSLIGDYDSLLVLYVGTPKQLVPSMKAESVALYLLYKCCASGDILKLHGSASCVKDVFGRDVVCLGVWKVIVNIHQSLSAVSALHSTLKSNKPNYQDLCDRCVEDFNMNSDSTGCQHH
jgi:hypothetical protein